MSKIERDVYFLERKTGRAEIERLKAELQSLHAMLDSACKESQDAAN